MVFDDQLLGHAVTVAAINYNSLQLYLPQIKMTISMKASDKKSYQRVICASCGFPFDPSEFYCPNCKALTTEVSNLDPMRAIATEGLLLSKATQGKQKPIVLVGIWILFLPILLVSLLFAASTIYEDIGTGFGGFFFFWGAIALAVLAFSVLFKVTRNYFGWTIGGDDDGEEDEDEEVLRLNL